MFLNENIEQFIMRLICICKYPPLHLILLEGVKTIPNNCFAYYSGGSTCVVTLANSMTHIGGRAFDSNFIFENFIFPDSIEYLGRYPIMNVTANNSQVHGLAADNCWAYNSTISISKKKFEFPRNLHFYNSLHYVGSNLKGYYVVSYDTYDSDTIIVGPKCDTLYAKLNAKIGYFYNENPVKSWSYHDFCIDTLYIPEGSLSKYLNEYSYREALKPESGQPIKALKEMKKVRNIEILNEEPTCLIGEEIKMQASILPVDAFNKSFTWLSSNSSIASVDKKGIVNAKKAGDVWIIAISDENDSVRDSCKITVVQPVTGITLSHSNCRLTTIGESVLLEATILPNDATNQEVRWASSNEAVCVVANGKVVATGYGTAVVMCTTDDGGFMATCTVVVEKETVPIASVVLSKTTVTMAKGETLQLTATTLPNDATDKTLIWKSSDEGICVVTQSGLLIAMQEGKAMITVYPNHGAGQAQCEVTVSNAVDGILSVGYDGNETDEPIYDILGRRAKCLVKGSLYIQNGKKFIAQ